MNPPKIILDDLTREQQRQVILLALEVVHDLAREEVFTAYEKIVFAKMENDVYEGFWSLLNSTQRSTLKDVSQAYHQGETQCKA